MTRLAIFIGVCAVGVVPSRALAYRTFEDDPAVARAARQPSDVIAWDIVAPDATDPDAASFQAAATAAFDTWSAASCTSLSHRFEGRSTQPAAPGDGRNSIELVRAGWLDRGFPAGRGATTDVQLRTLEGQAEIVEADIYVNLDDFEFVSQPMPDALDRQGVLTHEIGHLLGLLHPCELEAGTAPTCVDVVDADASVLYPTYLGARSLSPDDEAGLCALYPSSGCPLSCAIGFECAGAGCVPCATLRCEAPVCPGPDCSPPTCGADGECAVGACARAGEHAGECVLAGDFGTECTAANDCVSGLCLVGASTSFCTSRCVDDTGCEGETRCGAVGSSRVCEPLPASAGCAVRGTASGSRGSRGAPIWGMALCLVLAARRKRGTKGGAQ